MRAARDREADGLMHPPLESCDMQQTVFEIDLIPPQAGHLAGTKPMLGTPAISAERHVLAVRPPVLRAALTIASTSSLVRESRARAGSA